MAQMDGQTLAAAGDAAQIIIVEFGTNDADDAGLTAKYQANLEALKLSNPTAVIIGMGILPRTSHANRDANNPRIETACAGAGVTYWNTDGWIDPATETSDGTHPTDAGYQKIATEALNRLVALGW
jgi:lysophospholipase L1-like esterase